MHIAYSHITTIILFGIHCLQYETRIMWSRKCFRVHEAACCANQGHI